MYWFDAGTSVPTTILPFTLPGHLDSFFTFAELTQSGGTLFTTPLFPYMADRDSIPQQLTALWQATMLLLGVDLKAVSSWKCISKNFPFRIAATEDTLHGYPLEAVVNVTVAVAQLACGWKQAALNELMVRTWCSFSLCNRSFSRLEHQKEHGEQRSRPNFSVAEFFYERNRRSRKHYIGHICLLRCCASSCVL